MSTPLYGETEYKTAMADSFSKTVMRNACRNYFEKKKLDKQKETVGTEKMQYLFEQQAHEDVYPSEHLILTEHDYICVVSNELLYRAIQRLPEKQKEVLILEFWYGLSMKQIREMMGVSAKTIYNWKQKAFQSIRDYYERNQDGRMETRI